MRTFNRKLIGGGVAVILVLLVLWAFGGRTPEEGPAAEAPSPTATTTAETAAPQPPQKTTPQTAKPAPRPVREPAAGIAILSPAKGAEWTIGENHAIKWSKESGVAGGLSLISLPGRETVGWILSLAGPHQVSYEWNTKEIALVRESALRKDIATGEYAIRLHIDRKPPVIIESAPFAIIYASQATIPVYTVAMKDFSFAPASLTVKKGNKVEFTNNDTVSYAVILGSASPVAIPAGASHTFETTSFFPGLYDFYDPSYAGMRGVLTVE